MADYDEDGIVIEPRPQLPTMLESRPQNLIFSSDNPGEVFGALCAMQGTMEAPKRTKTAKVKGRTRNGGEYEYSYAYAPLDEIINTIKLPMANAGLAYRQFLASRDGQWVMRTVIAHQTGEWFGCDYPIFWDESRGMQGFASGVTYARRYGLMLALGIAAEDDDDANVADGNAAVVQDRRQGRSGGRQAQGSAPAATPASNASPAPQQAPSASAVPSEDAAKKREQAVNDWKAARAAIDNAPSAAFIDGIMASNDWQKLVKDTHAVNDEQTAVSVMQKLIDRAERRKALLTMPPEGEPQEHEM